jgi:hypothetical protein
MCEYDAKKLKLCCDGCDFGSKKHKRGYMVAPLMGDLTESTFVWIQAVNFLLGRLAGIWVQ